MPSDSYNDMTFGGNTGRTFWDFLGNMISGRTANDLRSDYTATALSNPSNSPTGSSPILSSIPGAQGWQDMARAGANAAPRANPYSMNVAAQTLPAQQQLFQQMRAQQAGPSIANMQAQGAQGNNLQAALRARGGNAAVAQQAGGVANTISNEAATARLAEQLAGSAQQGGLSSGMRNRSEQAAKEQNAAALQARALDNAARLFYAQRGNALNTAQGRAGLEYLKLQQLLSRKYDQGQKQNVDGTLQAMGTVASLA